MRHALVFIIILMTCLNGMVICSKLVKNHHHPIVQQDFQNTPPSIPTVPEPEKPPRIVEPQFVDVPIAANRSNEDSVLADILNHSRSPSVGDGRGTDAHETTHMINSDLRNGYQQSGKRVNGFYVLNGKGVIVDEPNMQKREVASFIPKSLIGMRYKLYVTGSPAWEDRPTYIFDEWVAYVNGSISLVDDAKKGRHREGWVDGVMGSLEFSIYSVAVCMAVESKDPEFFKNNEQFKNFVHWNLKRSKTIYDEGSVMKDFKWDKQDALLQAWRTSPDAQAMRNFMIKHFDGIWLE